MNDISTLNSSGSKRAMLYKYKGDDGLLVEYSHGRMDWYRVDNRSYVSLNAYSYWEPA